MKTKIKVLMQNNAMVAPSINPKGDWIDLRAAEDIKLDAPTPVKHLFSDAPATDRVQIDNKLVSLGVAIQLPGGFEAWALPRSSTFNNFGVIMGNSKGIMDNSYCGPNDIWKFNAVALRECTINGPRPATEEDYKNSELTIINGWVQGDRICQFRIALSQKATVWQKLKWLFSNGIEIEVVDSLNNKNRGGIGSTGKH